MLIIIALNERQLCTSLSFQMLSVVAHRDTALAGHVALDTVIRKSH